MAAAILMIWTDIPAEIEADFNVWYNREHLPDRIQRMPGFLRGRRYAAMAGAPKFLTLYDLESSAVMLSAGGGPHLLAAPCALRMLYTLHAPARAGALP